MESKKIEKLKKMLVDAETRNELIIVKLLKEIQPTIENVSDDVFDERIFNKINSLSERATTLLKKKEQTIAEQEIYCISLLSFCFFDKLIEVSIEKKKVKIIDKRCQSK